MYRIIRWMLLSCLFMPFFTAHAALPQIDASSTHVMLIKEDGTLWTWGYGKGLGLGENVLYRNRQTQIGSDNDWAQIATGNDFTIAIKNDGTLWSWGTDSHDGLLGQGYVPDDIMSPKQIGTENNWKHISVGTGHVLAVKTNGTLWGWGRNFYYQLGQGADASRNDYTVPTQIGSDTDWTYVSAGGNSSFAIKSDNTLWGWGDNGFKLGLGDITADQPAPTQIGTDSDWESVSGGYYCTLAIKTDHTLWAWGNESQGCAGNGSNSATLYTPTKIGTDTDWKHVNIFNYHVLAIKTDNTLWAWGANQSGQIGDGSIISSWISGVENPTQIGDGTVWTTAAAGGGVSIAIDNNGEIWAWGGRAYGGLADANELYEQRSPVRVNNAAQWNVIAAGKNHSLIAASDTGLWASGVNDSRQLGNGGSSDSYSLTNIDTATQWIQAAAGEYHSLAIKSESNASSGSLWAWGSSNTGIDAVTNTPTQVGTDTDWKQISARDDHSVAIKTNGTLWSWGNNLDGRLGNGTTTLVRTPEQVGSDTDWAQASAGGAHTLALKSDNSLWAWGDNYYGQIGNAGNTDVTIPEQIGTEKNWQQVSAGGDHSLAIKTDGTLWAWGRNYEGQLGDGTQSTRREPVQIGSDADWAYIAAGDNFSIAIKNDHSLWAWGNNDYGHLGNQSLYDALSPVQVGSDMDWEKVSIGMDHVLALKTDGSLWGWGHGTQGQLALSDVTKVTTPQKILPPLALTTTPAAWATPGESYLFTIEPKTHELGNTPSYELINYPTHWLTYDNVNNTLSGVASSEDVGAKHPLEIVLTDNYSSMTHAFPININGAPTISGSPPSEVAESTNYYFNPRASDVNGLDTVHFSITGMPPWATFNSETGALSGTPQATDAGVYSGIKIRVTDSAGAWAELPEFSITVTANLPPSISGTPKTATEGYYYVFNAKGYDQNPGTTLTYTIDNAPAWATFASTSAWGGRLTGTPQPGDAGDYPITITVTDDAGASATLSVTITVEPYQPPTISGTPGDAAEGTNYWFVPTALDPAGNHISGGFSIDQKPAWATFSTSSGSLSGTPQVGDAGVYPNITITVTDATGGKADLKFDLTVTTNHVPTISGTPAESVREGQRFYFRPKASDPDEASVVNQFSITNKPEWATFRTWDGQLSGTPQAGDVGVYSDITITVTDDAGATAELTFNLTVEANQPPTISGTPTASMTEGDSFLFSPTASDPDEPSLTYQFSIENKPDWATFDSWDGELSGTPQIGDAGLYSNITIIVTDDMGATAELKFDLTVDANQPPTISGTPTASMTEGDSFRFKPTASDPEGDTLYNQFSIENKPGWATFDSTDGELTGTPKTGDAGVYNDITIIVTDSFGLTNKLVFDITVKANQPPVINGTPPTSVVEGSNYYFDPDASDPEGSKLTYSIENKPDWATFNSWDGELSGTPKVGDAGVYNDITIIVTDSFGLTNKLVFDITVKANQPPVINGTPPTSVVEGSNYYFDPDASDPEGSKLTYSIENKPDWAIFSITDGSLSGTPSTDDVGVYSNVTIVVTDATGTTDEMSFTITVTAANNNGNGGNGGNDGTQNSGGNDVVDNTPKANADPSGKSSGSAISLPILALLILAMLFVRKMHEANNIQRSV